MKLPKLFIFFIFFSLLVSVSLSTSGQQTVKPLNWRELVSFLPEIPGWEAEGDASGQTMSMGAYSMTSVEREYTSGDKNLKITIIDGALAQMAYAGFRMLRQFELDTSDEYIKKIEVKGFPGVEKYTYADKEAEVFALVADRFIVQLEEDNVEDGKELKGIAESLALKKLASLAK